MQEEAHGLPQPRGWASVWHGPEDHVSLALTVLMFDLFQALLLEQNNDSITTLEKHLEM